MAGVRGFRQFSLAMHTGFLSHAHNLAKNYVLIILYQIKRLYQTKVHIHQKESVAFLYQTKITVL